MFDAAVIGLGVMGSAAAWALARRGLRIVGLERFGPAHDRGSSHGLTRVIRQAYYEHPDYVPLVLRSYELWAELERESGRTLFRKTGAFMIGPEESPLVRGALASARAHGLRHRLLPAGELRSRFPFMLFDDRDVAVEEFDAGILQAEAAVLAFQEAATRRGAELRFLVEGKIGDPPAAKTVLAAGPWMPSLAPGLPLQVERQVLYWFDPVSDADRIPLFMRDVGGTLLYVIPDATGDGVKAAIHHRGEITDPDRVRREVGPGEEAEMRALLSRSVPPLGGRLRAAKVCLYTNTPDGHFAIGERSPGVFVASPCSGHGFKFAPVVGEILADLVVEGRTQHPIGLFRLDRFGGQGSRPIFPLS